MTEPIIGGHLDTTTKGVVALAFKAKNQVSVFCSGSLLAPNLVLTARHCVARIGDGSSEEVHCASSQFTARYDPRQIFVSTDSQPKSGGQLFSVKEIREAPGSTNVCGYDVALLILSGSGVPSSVATPIEPALSDPTVAKAQFSAVGYGLQDPQDTQGTTAGSRMRFDSSTVYCVAAGCPTAADTWTSEFVGNSPVCSGDSGGPALNAKGRVFGVTSRGDSACTYALYSNVASWADFVRNTALDAAASGGYVPLSWASPGSVEPGTAGSGGTSSGGTSSGSTNAGSGGTSSDSSGAGGSLATVPPSQPVTPIVDPLGAACAATGECPGTYQCYSASGTPPGICVPPCRAGGASCPARYACSESLGVCTPSQSLLGKSKVSASCSLSTTGPLSGGRPWPAALGLGLLYFGRRRRRGR